MKRLHGVKRNDLKKIASSSDNYIKKTQPIIEEESSHIPLPVESEIEDIQFDEPWEETGEHHENDASEVYGDEEPYDEEQNMEPDEVRDGEPMSQQKSENIFDRLEHMSQTSPRSAQQRNAPSLSTPGHGFKPTAKILQRKEDYVDPMQNQPSSPRVTVPIGINRGGTSRSEPQESVGRVKVNISKPTVQKGSIEQPKEKPKTITVPPPSPTATHKPSARLIQEEEPTEPMHEADEEEDPVPISRSKAKTVLMKEQKEDESAKLHHVVGQLQIDDSKYIAVLDNFAKTIEKANATIDNIIQYTQHLADAMAEATQDGSRELLNTTKDILAQLAANTHASIHELNEASKKGHVELNKNAAKTLEQLTKKVDEYVTAVSQSNADVAQQLSENSKALSESSKALIENVEKLSQYTTSIVESADESNKQMAITVQTSVQEMQKVALEYLHETTKSVEKSLESLQNAHDKSAEHMQERLQEMTDRMVQTTEDCINKLFDAVEQMSANVGTTIRKALDDHIRLRYRDQTHMIHMLQQHVVALQQQITNFVRSGAVVATASPAGTSAGVQIGVGVPTSVNVMNFPAVPDSFMDPIIDLSEHTCSYDAKEVEKIVRDMAELTKVDESSIYRVKEKMGITWEAEPELLDSITAELVAKYSDLFSTSSSNPEHVNKVRNVIRETVDAKSEAKKLDKEKRDILEYLLSAQVAGIGRLQPLMDDPDTTEILVVGKDKVFCIVNGKQRLTDIKFRSKEEVKDLAISIVNKIGRELNNENPRCDAKLDNGTRVHAIIPPASANGDTIITMRKPPGATRPIGIKELVAVESLSLDMVEFFKMCVQGRANIILYGETNSGKTTFVRAMSNFFDPYERIISLEDTQELNLLNYHYVPLEAVKRPDQSRSIGIHDLFVDTLRMSPDRLIIGEVRGKEGGDLIEAFQSGQRGGITTMHAGSAKQVVTRLVIMMSRAQLGISETIMRQMIHDSIDIVVQCRRLPDGTRKITRVTELLPLDEAERLGVPPFRDIFRFEQREIVRDDKGKIVKIVGEHKYKAHLSPEKLTRYFEFGVDIPPKFGSVIMD